MEMLEMQWWLERVPSDDYALERRRMLIRAWRGGDLQSANGCLYVRQDGEWRVLMTPENTPWDGEGLPDDLLDTAETNASPGTSAYRGAYGEGYDWSQAREIQAMERGWPWPR